MERKVVAEYRRESTLWKNANGFYRAQDYTRMTCIVYDYTEELEEIYDPEYGIKWFDSKGNDVTEREVEKRYGKPYAVEFKTESRWNGKGYSFKTKEEANNFVKSVLKDRILGNFKRVK